MTADQWNQAHRVGTSVAYHPVEGRAGYLLTRTRSPAWTLESGIAVVSLVGSAGGKALTHLSSPASVDSLSVLERMQARTAKDGVPRCEVAVIRWGPRLGRYARPYPRSVRCPLEAGGDYHGLRVCLGHMPSKHQLNPPTLARWHDRLAP